MLPTALVRRIGKGIVASSGAKSTVSTSEQTSSSSRIVKLGKGDIRARLDGEGCIGELSGDMYADFLFLYRIGVVFWSSEVTMVSAKLTVFLGVLK